jgi:transcriptional regulator with XRE-family HTH domain
MPSIALGADLREARRNAGLTLPALANEIGISFSLLGSIERGEANPSLDVLWKLCRRFPLGLGPAMLVTGARILDVENENRLDLRALPEDLRTRVILLLADDLLQSGEGCNA